MMVEVSLHDASDRTLTIWLKDLTEAHAVVEKVLEPIREAVAITGYERRIGWHKLSEDEYTLSYLPKTLYINEFVLAVEVVEYPNENL